MFSEAHRSEVSNTLKQRQAEISHEADVKVAALRAEMETAHTQAEVVKQRALEEARREAEQGKQQLQRELAAAETKQRLNEVHARAQGAKREEELKQRALAKEAELTTAMKQALEEAEARKQLALEQTRSRAEQETLRLKSELEASQQQRLVLESQAKRELVQREETLKKEAEARTTGLREADAAKQQALNEVVARAAAEKARLVGELEASEAKRRDVNSRLTSQQQEIQRDADAKLVQLRSEMSAALEQAERVKQKELEAVTMRANEENNRLKVSVCEPQRDTATTTARARNTDRQTQ